jgi:predicted RNA polymerase sigma factor
MQPTEARDVGDALEDRPVPGVWPRPTHVGTEKYLAGFWLVEAADLDVALKLAAEGSKACNWKDQFARLDPSPIIALNRAIAIAELDGPEVALAAIHRLEDKLTGYHPYHATRADLLRRLGRSQEARAAYDKAIDLAGNTAETAHLTRRRDQLG